MRCILLLSLYHKKFKKDSRLRIFLDDMFIDELTLDDIPLLINPDPRSSFIDTKKFVVKGNTYGLPGEKIFLYDLEINDSNKKIILEFKNNDNNYSNGFMTNTALTQIRYIGLIEKKILLDNDFESLLKKRTEQRTKIKEMIKKMGHDDDKIKHGYPFYHEWFCHTKEKTEKKCADDHMGGEFVVECTIRKKDKTYFLTTAKENEPIGWLYIHFFIVWLRQQKKFNKYLHEDQ